MSPRRPLAVVAALALGVLLGGCVSGGPGAPSGSGDPTEPGSGDPAVAAAWLDDGRSLGIVTWGSSTCAPMAGEPTYAGGVLTVALSDVAGQTCADDSVARATVVSLPQGVDPSQDLSIEVTGAHVGRAMLAADPDLTPRATHDSEYLPSAGWFAPNGFLLLSWGSSSCAPRLVSATASAADEVTATFATPPADQVCTADMAPRVTVGTVSGIDATTDVELVLRGDDFDSVRVAIAGSR